MNPELQNLINTQYPQSPIPVPSVNTQVSASNLTTPPASVSLPSPQQPTQPSQFVQTLAPAIQSGSQGVQSLQQQFIQSQSEEAQQRNDVLNRLLSFDGTDQAQTFESAFQKSVRGLTGQNSEDFIRQLNDANTSLATLQGKFRSAEQATSAAQGQTKRFEGVQLNELDRQKAVEVGNQALLVQALQGNFETARQIALDTANFAQEDRKLELDNLTRQYDALTGIVDAQTQQLLDQEKIKIETEKAQIERTQNLVDSAIVAGMATVEEMQYLTSTQVSDTEKQRIAMEIINRGARSDRFASSGSGSGSGEDMVASTDAQAQAIIADLSIVSGLLADTQGLNKAVGTRKTNRGVTRRGAGEDFVSKLDNLLSSGVLKQISDAKAMGVTFGALSEGELTLIANASNAINNSVERDKNGRVVGYKTSEQNMRNNLKVIEDNLKNKYQATTGTPFLTDEELLNPTGTQNSVYSF